MLKKDFKLLDLIKCEYHEKGKYIIIPLEPATGVLYITKDTPYFMTGDIRARGKGKGRYPYNFLETLDYVFGPEKNTIEVCSYNSRYENGVATVDINPANNPDVVDDAQVLSKFQDNSYNRWRCDPPYNGATAKKMYSTTRPKTSKLLVAGARVCKSRALLFLLLGPQNYQWHPPSTKRIGLVKISVVPNNEIRCLNIFHKL